MPLMHYVHSWVFKSDNTQFLVISLLHNLLFAIHCYLPTENFAQVSRILPRDSVNQYLISEKNQTYF